MGVAPLSGECSEASKLGERGRMVPRTDSDMIVVQLSNDGLGVGDDGPAPGRDNSMRLAQPSRAGSEVCTSNEMGWKQFKVMGEGLKTL